MSAPMAVSCPFRWYFLQKQNGMECGVRPKLFDLVGEGFHECEGALVRDVLAAPRHVMYYTLPTLWGESRCQAILLVALGSSRPDQV